MNDALFPGEIIPSGEAEAIASLVQMAETQVRRAAVSDAARRDAHAKAHGCVKAEFRVLESLPDELRAGVFTAPRTFAAWIRFSNGNGKPQTDFARDGRGMAIKLMGVENSPSTTQDFLLINNPTFFVRNAVDYVEFQKADNPLWFFFPSLNPFAFRLHEAFNAFSTAFQRLDNPLNCRYWSMTPYRYGDAVCKFSARPTGTASTFTSRDIPDFLRGNLRKHLAIQSASFDFIAQIRKRSGFQPIEDPTIEWNEATAPFVPVARVIIHPQNFDSREQLDFCENLSFNPWHCDDAHRPLGGINRARRAVYQAVSQLRHELNGAVSAEPTAL